MSRSGSSSNIRVGGLRSRGQNFRSSLRSGQDHYQEDDDGEKRPSQEEISMLEQSIQYGTDYTQRGLDGFRPTTPSELKDIFGTKNIQQQSQRHQTMNLTAPEYDAFLAEKRLEKLPRDRTTLGGFIKDSFYDLEGDLRSPIDIVDRFIHDQPPEEAKTNAYHSIMKPGEQSALTKEYQDYNQFRLHKQSASQQYQEEKKALALKHTKEEVKFRLDQLKRDDEESLSKTTSQFRPIPEIDNEAIHDQFENGITSVVGKYQKRPHSFRNSALYRDIPLISDLYEVIHMPTSFREAGGFKRILSNISFLTPHQERRKIKESADKIRASIKDLTPDTLNDLYYYTEEQLNDEEQIRRMDIYFRQQHALLEELSNQGILDVPLLTDESKDVAFNNIQNHLTKYILPQTLYPNEYHTTSESKLYHDTFFSSTLPPEQAFDYRLQQAQKTTEPKFSGTQIMSQLNQIDQQMIENYIDPNKEATTWYDGFIKILMPNYKPINNNNTTNMNQNQSNMNTILQPQFLSTSHLDYTLDSKQQPIDPKDTGLFATLMNLFSPKRLHEQITIHDIELQHNTINNDYEKHRSTLYELKTDPFGKSARELAAEHMHALNTNTYYKTDTPKGKLLDQIEQLQILLRNENIPPEMKLQLKVHQQQAFLAFYQIEKDEQEGKFDVGYTLQQQDKRLIEKAKENELRRKNENLFIDQSQQYGSMFESDFATQRRLQKQSEYELKSKMGQNGITSTDQTTQNQFRPIYNYKSPPIHPIKRRFDEENPILVINMQQPQRSFHPCNEFEDLYRHCVMDNNNNIASCRKEYKVYQTCKNDHVMPIDRNSENHNSLFQPPPETLLKYPRRPTSLVDKFSIDTTFPFDH